ncbi:hypothetical protein [Hyalangium versicolor]|uniref:hypothetical protein n=1 Tax=Hyalangium versicolor TaxID=2861190 RepID=UPI001CCA3ECC|nr:hypothetical protein [Hyalangium versicolor]
MRLSWQGLLLVLFLAVPAFAAPKPNPFLAQAKVHYQGLEFEKCLKRLEQAGRWKDNTRAEQVDIELYSGLCSFSLGNETDARKAFSLALELDPKVELPAYSSPRLITFFDALAQGVPGRAAPVAETPPAQPEPTPAPVAPPPVQEAPRKVELQPPAPGPTPVLTQTAPAPEPKKVLLPLLLSGTSVAAAGGAIYFDSQARSHEKQANDRDTFYEDALASQDKARRDARLANAAIGVATAAAVGAVLAYVLQ